MDVMPDRVHFPMLFVAKGYSDQKSGFPGFFPTEFEAKKI